MGPYFQYFSLRFYVYLTILDQHLFYPSKLSKQLSKHQVYSSSCSTFLLNVAKRSSSLISCEKQTVRTEFLNLARGTQTPGTHQPPVVDTTRPFPSIFQIVVRAKSPLEYRRIRNRGPAGRTRSAPHVYGMGNLSQGSRQKSTHRFNRVLGLPIPCLGRHLVLSKT